ncbi:MAG: hypothetical protein F6K56_38490 [Moorea sp. SIO3G5]|nr:hypothetical protein [Moorena sp. SIO3G5]
MINKLKQCSSREVWGDGEMGRGGDGEMGSHINNFSKPPCMATPDSRF